MSSVPPRYSKIFMHRTSECWPNHFIPSVTHVNQAYFPNNSKVVPAQNISFLAKSVFHAWVISFMHTFHVTPRVSCTQSQSLVEFSSIKVGCICIELIFQDIARFQHGFSVWWRILFGPSTFHDIARYSHTESQYFGDLSVFQRRRALDAYFSRYSKFLLSESHYRCESSSFQLGLACFRRTFPDTARFRAQNFNSWRIHFIPSGTR